MWWVNNYIPCYYCTEQTSCSKWEYKSIRCLWCDNFLLKIKNKDSVKIYLKTYFCKQQFNWLKVEKLNRNEYLHSVLQRCLDLSPSANSMGTDLLLCKGWSTHWKWKKEQILISCLDSLWWTITCISGSQPVGPCPLVGYQGIASVPKMIWQGIFS